MKIGVLALQGCVDPHLKMLAHIGAEGIPIRSAIQLELIDRIILPGGESTTMLRLLGKSQLMPALREFGKTNPIWGICAGAILIAQEVKAPEQASLNLIAMRANRNFYGSQVDSFKAEVNLSFLNSAVMADFIRAPLLEPLSPEVSVLGHHEDQAVFLRQGHVLASSFHIELGEDTRLHEYFVGVKV